MSTPRTTQGEQTPVEHQGLVFKFPFQTEKETYDFWDSSLGKTVPIEYVGEEDVEGIPTYKFEHTIEPTVTETLEVPASVLGEPGDENLQAERTYSNHRTVWVEPVTGAVVDRTEEQLSTLRYDGEDRVTLTEAEVSYSQESVEDVADQVRSKAVLLRVLNPIIPIVGVIAGPLLIILGFLLVRRRRPVQVEVEKKPAPAEPATTPESAAESGRGAPHGPSRAPKIAVPGVSSPRTRDQPPQIRSCCSGHSGSSRSVMTNPFPASSATQSPRVRWCST